MAELYNTQRTSLPQDTKKVLDKDDNIDNLGILFNKLAHFGIKEDLEKNKGDISTIINGEMKAHFFAINKQKNDRLDLTQKWNPTNLQTHYKSFLETYFASAKALYSTHDELKLKANWRIAIGMGNQSVYENGFTLHPVYGIPYLPGSSIKGMVRHWAVAEGKDSAIIKAIFGHENDVKTKKEEFQQGQIIFFDAYPTELKKDMVQPDIMNNHYPDYYGDGQKPPADWQSPRPIFFLTMKNIEFQFFLGCTSSKTEHLETAKEWLEEALFESGIGAKTAVGYGRFEASPSIKKKEQDALNELKKPKPSFKQGPSDKKLKPNMLLEAIVTKEGKPCVGDIYGFGNKIYENMTIEGNVQNLLIGEVIIVKIQTDVKGERVMQPRYQQHKIK